MPAFLILDPRCVFIHNPKTGGQALRNVLLKHEYEGPITGTLPEHWQGHFTFSFVRNPFDRLISAWKMFSQGIEDTGWKVPLDLKPGMNLEEFLSIVTDDSVGFGLGDRSGKRRIRNHTLPQTHAFYSLDQASYLGRFESYETDVQHIFETIGLPKLVPEPKHVTKRGPYEQYFNARTREIATEYYAADLEKFNYQF